MPQVLSMRRHVPARSVAAIAAVLAVGICCAWSASARAANNYVTSFSLTPSSLTAAGDPNIVSTMAFNYTGDTSTTPPDTVKDITVTLPPGLLAAPGALSAECTPAQLTAYTCPAGSLIGTASGTTAAAVPLTANLYLMPPTSTSDVAELGADLVAVTSTTTTANVGAVSGPINLIANSAGKPELQMAIDGLPQTVTITGEPTPVPVQLTGLTVTINGVAPSSSPFTRMPSLCSAASASLSIDTYTGTADGSATSTPFTPTGCSTLPYAPALSAAGVKDSADDGVTVVTQITQAADEATSQSVKLTIPSNVSPNLIAAAGLLCGTPNATFSNCTAVGSAAANSPLLPASTTLAGAVYLTGTLDAPELTVAFPPPFALELNGAIAISSNSVDFTNVPDVPLTKLIVDLKGSANSLFTTDCNPVDATAAAAFVDQNGDESASKTAPFDVSGCPTTTTPPPVTTAKPGAPKLSSSSLAGVSSGKAKLSFTLTAGDNKAPDLAAATVSLPGGISFVKAKLKKGVSVTGGKVKSVSLKGGKLVITLKSAVAKFSVKVSSSALKVSSSLASKVKKHKVKTLKLGVTAKDAKGTSTGLSATVKV